MLHLQTKLLNLNKKIYDNKDNNWIKINICFAMRKINLQNPRDIKEEFSVYSLF